MLPSPQSESLGCATILTLLTFAGVFFAAAYYATNADEYVDAHWDEYIYPELVKTNATQIPEVRPQDRPAFLFVPKPCL